MAESVSVDIGVMSRREAAFAGAFYVWNMATTESHVDPLTVYAAHSFENDRSYQVS